MGLLPFPNKSGYTFKQFHPQPIENTMKTELKKTFFCMAVLAGLSICFGISYTFAQDADRKAGDRMVMEIKDVEYAFRWCPPGTFMMGAGPGEAGVRGQVGAQHRVTLTRGFWMLETAVTQQMWISVMGNNPSGFKGDRLPVEYMSWYDCYEYIRKLNELGVAPAGYKFSFPTEAQWEYACRAGTTTPYFFGDTLYRDQANFEFIGTVEVDVYPPNAWGLISMHGNTLEWCQDWFGPYPTGEVTDPTGPETGTEKAMRGGRWRHGSRQCRSGTRDNSIPGGRSTSMGLRLVLIPDSK